MCSRLPRTLSFFLVRDTVVPTGVRLQLCNGCEVTISTRVNDGQWHTLEFARRGDTVFFAVDGISGSATGMTGTAVNDGPLLIGGLPDDAVFVGQVDYLVFQRGPTSREQLLHGGSSLLQIVVAQQTNVWL